MPLIDTTSTTGGEKTATKKGRKKKAKKNDDGGDYSIPHCKRNGIVIALVQEQRQEMRTLREDALTQRGRLSYADVSDVRLVKPVWTTRCFAHVR